ncbi:hypothetical protein [Desulfomicrobium norvegicum]|uniref:hypothetical protein n=1 Tax=Desulfomicrobium norvegicum (strain DSM 1741 / NCIMB 8310) TaxID=52561 RepID=UPI0011609CB3|nr:hypothetical protein [Desulfomicrobium norvegicum]
MTTISSTNFEETIVVLQPFLNKFLSVFDGEIFVLTHRCRYEASQIVDLYPELSARVKRIVAAEDLAVFSIQYGKILDLFRKGVQKSYVCDYLKSNGFDIQSFIFIDDNINNLNLLSSCGCGACFCFPRPNFIDNHIVTFDIKNLCNYQIDKNVNSVIYLVSDVKYFLSSCKNHSVKKNMCYSYSRKMLKFIRLLLFN